MAQFGDFIARLFSSGGTLGLSGEASSVFQPGPENAVYKDLLRRHRADQDLVADPSLVWATSAVLRRRGGLVAHVMSQKSDTVAGFTDILIILNQADWRRALRDRGEAWLDRLTSLVRDRFDSRPVTNSPVRRPSVWPCMSAPPSSISRMPRRRVGKSRW